jgi:two-component system response regulator FixJ
MNDGGIIHIIDDDDAIRESLSFLLQAAGFGPVTYESADIFLERLEHIEAGCIITDVRMPGLTGIELLRRLQKRDGSLPVIVITGHADVPLAVEALKAGAFDFIEKPFDDELLISVVRKALRVREEARRRNEARAAILQRIESLTPRERQVFEGLVAGHANKTIAFDLGISPRTVEIYRANVMGKLQASSLSELVKMALLIGEETTAPPA